MEAVTEEVAAHSTRVSLSTETQRQLTEHKAPRHELLCKPDSSLYSASTTVAVSLTLKWRNMTQCFLPDLPLQLCSVCCALSVCWYWSGVPRVC